MISTQQLYLQVKGKWKSIYPIYFDSKKTIKQGIDRTIIGRRLPKKLCLENPSLPELAQAVAMCKLRLIVQQHKSYPRDYFERGRLKVQLYDDKKNPIHKHIPNKSQMMRQTAKCLLKNRQK